MHYIAKCRVPVIVWFFFNVIHGGWGLIGNQSRMTKKWHRMGYSTF